MKCLTTILALLVAFTARAPVTLAGKATLAGKNSFNQAAAGGGGSNVTYDTSAKSAAGVGVATRTIAITVASQSNRLLIVGAGAGDATAADKTVDSVSSNVDGAFTHISGGDADDNNWPRMEGWYLKNPTVGAHTITVTYSGGATDQALAFAISLYGVDQTTPIGTPVVSGAGASGAAPTGSVTLGSDDMAVGLLSSDSDATLSWTVGTSRQTEIGVGSDSCYGLATNTGTGSVACTASTENLGYAIVVLPVNGAP